MSENNKNFINEKLKKFIFNKKIVEKKLKNFKDVEYTGIYEEDYEIIYQEYENLKNKIFYELDEEFLAVEVLPSLMHEYIYELKVCDTLQEFLDEITYVVFDKELME